MIIIEASCSKATSTSADRLRCASPTIVPSSPRLRRRQLVAIRPLTTIRKEWHLHLSNSALSPKPFDNQPILSLDLATLSGTMTTTYGTTFPAMTPLPSSYPTGSTPANLRMLQIVATTTSLVTLLATVVTVYMFHRMPKRMRHKCVGTKLAEALRNS